MEQQVSSLLKYKNCVGKCGYNKSTDSHPYLQIAMNHAQALVETEGALFITAL